MKDLLPQGAPNAEQDLRDTSEEQACALAVSVTGGLMLRT